MLTKSECDKASGPTSELPQRKILDAIRWVESGNDPDPPDGDGGKAIGPYQIRLEYFLDGRDQLRDEGLAIDWLYPEMRDREKAEIIIGAYMRRYCPLNWLWCRAEAIARTHNGGPRSYLELKKTDAYWAKVKKRLQSEEKA